MCEYVSFLASDFGPTLQLYFSTGLTSHANIREAYNLCSVGAECEWTGNSPDNLVVRHQDKDTARLIKQMILDKYPTLKDMLQDIKTIRDKDGTAYVITPDTYLTPEERKDAIPGMLEKHTLWVETEGKEGVCADFSWWDLFSTDLQSANLQSANLQSANLEYVNLRNANLQNANLQDADLQDANLQDANLQDANLQNANLQDANLQDANLQNANLRNANLRNANLRFANLPCAYLHSVDLQHANLQNADLQDANLQDANLQSANLRNANLQDADLQNANLECANLQDARNVPDYIKK
jgi:hypothetical protein